MLGRKKTLKQQRKRQKNLEQKRYFYFIHLKEYIKDTQVKGLILIKCLNTNSKGIEYAFIRQEKLEQYQFMKGQIKVVLFFISMVVGCII